MLPEDMRHLLNYDEKVTWILRGAETVVVTDQRLIIRKSTGLGLKKSFVDYPYSNMVNIRLDRGVLRASVEVLMKSGVQSVKIGSLPKTDAFQLHRILREHVIQTSDPPPSQPFPVIIQHSEKQKEMSADLKCNKCGRQVSHDFSICPFCRYALKIECPECTRLIDRKFKLCPYCGEDLTYLQKIDLEI